jgi:RNA polymerase sigma factor (TIGR02999 family)
VSDQTPAITQLLQRWGEGDQSAFDALASVVYPELRRIAAARMRSERPGHTLQATAVVNELFMRLMTAKQPDFKNRAQFYAVAVRIIRQVLVDHARRKLTDKRGQRPDQVSLDDVAVLIQPHGVDMLALDEALKRLEAVSKRKVEVFELRFFAGFSDQEVGELMNVTAMTVNRDFRAAKAWVAEALELGKK